MTDRVVLTMKWGTLYGPEYVNILYRAVRDHLPGKFRFACLTDDDAGLDSAVDAYPLDQLPSYAHRHRGGCWPKVDLYLPDLFGLEGRALFLDLDVVVVGDLTGFFDHPGDYVGTDAWVRGSEEKSLNTTCFAFGIGEQTQIAKAFHGDPDAAVARFVNDQNFAGAHAHGLTFWPDGWVVSFKRHLRQPIGLDLVRPPRAPGPDTRVVAFHGDPRPIDLVGRKRPWRDLPHSVKCPVEWLDAYWRRYAD